MISPFDNLVWQAVDNFGTPLSMTREQWFALINSIMQQESRFKPDAISYTGAGIGLMQVNPKYWLKPFAVSREQLFEPQVNIEIGTQIAKDYITRYGTSGGLGAYYAGPANRLTDSAQVYARSVLTIYSSIFSQLRRLLTGTVQAGQSFFLEPTEPKQYFFDVLPEQGTETIESGVQPVAAEVLPELTLIWAAGFLLVMWLASE